MSFTKELTFCAALWIGTCAPNALFARAQDDTKPVAPDNTKVNKRDRNKSEPTADQQKMNSSDRDLTRKIRRAIVDDKSLSTYAHNVKIISMNGNVTLKGVVRSDEEKKAIESKATEVAGAGKVTNELSIKPGKDAAAKMDKQ